MAKRQDTAEAYKRGNFICNICKDEKPISEFGSHKNSNIYGLNSTCKECARKKDKFNKTRRAYGITEKQFQDMYDKQNGKCAVCSADMNFRGEVHEKYQSACIDHDHETNQVRELLCSACNRALGFFNDDINNIYNALKYLEKHGKVRLGKLQAKVPRKLAQKDETYNRESRAVADLPEA